MCPMCLATGGLYLAGGVSAGAVTTFFATKWFRKPSEPTASTSVTEIDGENDERRHEK